MSASLLILIAWSLLVQHDIQHLAHGNVPDLWVTMPHSQSRSGHRDQDLQTREETKYKNIFLNLCAQVSAVLYCLRVYTILAQSCVYVYVRAHTVLSQWCVCVYSVLSQQFVSQKCFILSVFTFYKHRECSTDYISTLNISLSIFHREDDIRMTAHYGFHARSCTTQCLNVT